MDDLRETQNSFALNNSNNNLMQQQKYNTIIIDYT